MGIIARSPIEVMLGEMAYGVSDETRYADLQAIASVISNRSTALDVTPGEVVANQGQFNAYGKSLPPGAAAYRALAEAAWNDVVENGPTHAGTFYATPAAAKNLPSGLKEVTAVEGGHRYFEDPYGRAIKTSVGYRAPTNLPTVRSAVAQRLAFETAMVNGEDFATPQARPDIINMTQNPALLAGVPLDQFDPNMSLGVVNDFAQMPAPDIGLAQQIETANAIPAEQIAAAASRFGQEPAPVISNPADLQAALSRMNTPAGNPFDITQAMNDAIASSVASSAASKTSRIGQSVDPSRMAASAPLSEADKALQDMMKEAAAANLADRFGAPAGPVTRSVQTTTVPGQVPAGSYVPGSMPVMDVSNVPANRVQSFSISPGDTINSPASLAAALGNFPGAMAAQRATPFSMTANPAQAAIDAAQASPAMADVAAEKGSRIGVPQSAALDTGRLAEIDASSMDQSRFGPDQMQTADAALKDAISRATATPSQPADIAGFSDAMAAQRGAPTGVDSAEMQAMAGHVTYANQKAVAAAEAQKAAERAALNAQFPGLAAPNFSQAINPSVPSMPTPSSLTADMTGQMPSAAVASEKTSRLAPAAEVSQATPEQQAAGYQEAAKSFAKAGMLNIGQQPPTDLSGNLPSNFDVLGTSIPAPALETVDVAPQPTIAAPVDVEPAPAQDVTTTTPSVTKTMPAVQQRQNTAMDVWGGKAQTGIATDGSTVSRLDDGRMGRFVPSQNYTVFSDDAGATWSSPIAGNQLMPAKPALATIQPTISKSLISRLIGALTGMSSPTGVATAGTDGGMTVGRDGPAGTPGGWGSGGSIDNPGSAGGFGSTKGIDPTGTR